MTGVLVLCTLRACQLHVASPFTRTPHAVLLQLVQSAGAVLLQREIPEPINHQVAAAAAAAGVPVMWDAGGQDLPLPGQLLPLLAFCSPNETELSRLTGLPTGSKEEVVAAARSLMAKGVKQVLVKLGAQGCMLLQVRRGRGWMPAGRGCAGLLQQLVSTAR